jgi:ubiquinone/menaquinone biosynthesis C-methylase UbiE
MHIPDITKAVAELSRVMAPGGLLVISEGNQSSLQAVLLRWLKRLLGRERAEVQRTPAGTEFWELTDAGRLMTRQADIPWLIEEFKRNGLDLMERWAGQFTEIYVILPWKPLRRLVHAFNNLYFQFPRLGGPSYGNLLLLRKRT